MVGPFQADPGNRIELTFDIENVGTASGTQDLVLTAEDGSKITVDTLQDLELQVDQLNSATLTWDIDNQQAEDTYQLCVESEDDSDCVEVLIGDIQVGSRLFGLAEDTGVYQYSASTPFDISSLSFTNTSFSIRDAVSNQNLRTAGLFFGDNGTKMFIGDYETDSVYEFSLDIFYTLSTASYTGVSVSTPDSSVDGLAFDSSGSRFYVISAQEVIYQYNLSTNWDLSTASNSGNTLDVSGEDLISRGVDFNNDGSKLYMAGGNSNAIYVYDLSTNYEISSASYSGVSLDTSQQLSETPTSTTFNDDGSILYVTDVNGIYSYSLSTPFDLSTATYVTSFTNTEDAFLQSIVWNK